MGVTIDGSQGLDTDNTELTLEVGGSEKARIDSSGNVGIGTSSPASPSHTKGTSSTGFYGNVVSTFEDSSNNYPALAFKGTSGHLFGMRCEGGESMTFATTPSGTSWNPVMRMDADGLKFNGDTSSANALDDYEEGTWSNALEAASGSFTMSYHKASYTKIGRVVYIQGRLVISSINTASGTYYINLPFTNISSSNREYYGVISTITKNVSYNGRDNHSISVEGNGVSKFYPLVNGENANWAVGDVSHLSGGSEIQFGGFYFTN